MRILRGLSSKFLPCGCLVGIYETYDAETVAVLDAPAQSCVHPAHRAGSVVPVDEDASTVRRSPGRPGQDARE
jgi:hypothetical protein